MSTPSHHKEVPASFAMPSRPWQVGGIGPLWTLFTLTLRQFLRGKRALVVLLLSLLPAGLALLVRSLNDGPRGGPPKLEIEFVFLFNMIPHALLPLTALLYGSGLILDEQEDQTLTYLLIRPLPKWGLYITKLLAALCMAGLLVSVFVLVTYCAIYIGSPEWSDVFPNKMAATMFVMFLAMVAYVAVFGAMSMIVQRSLIAGIVFIAVVEGVLANLPLVIRQLSVMYYFRVLAANWLSLDSRMLRAWNLHKWEDDQFNRRNMMDDPGRLVLDAPEPFTCVMVLLLTAVVATFLATRIFSRREFYVKTPESN